MTMVIVMTLIFLIGYSGIILENEIKVNKAASALIMSVLIWIVYLAGGDQILSMGYSHSWHDYLSQFTGPATHEMLNDFIVNHELLPHLSDTASILLFLLGAMGIVEIIDRFQGFRVLTDHIRTRDKVKLLWILGLLGFFLSAVLDNLTTTIVMISLIRKLINKAEDRWIFASIVVIAANAGGAWSPIGDVTTILLWIGGQITAAYIIKAIFLPSLANILIPLLIASFFVKGVDEGPEDAGVESKEFTAPWERRFILALGVAALVFVPVFKTFTHLPPYLGMMLGLGVLWVTTDIMLRTHPREDKRILSVSRIVRQLDAPTILYYAGILTTVAALSSSGLLDLVAMKMDSGVGNIYGIDMLIGMLSSLIDNASLVAASMGMYDIASPGASGYLSTFVVNGDFWTFLAYTAGTGGSMLIIGSAAGVAAMSMENISFGWYFKRMSGLAFLGYLAGAALFYFGL